MGVGPVSFILVVAFCQLELLICACFWGGWALGPAVSYASSPSWLWSRATWSAHSLLLSRRCEWSVWLWACWLCLEEQHHSDLEAALYPRGTDPGNRLHHAHPGAGFEVRSTWRGTLLIVYVLITLRLQTTTCSHVENLENTGKKNTCISLLSTHFVGLVLPVFSYESVCSLLLVAPCCSRVM